MGMLFHQLDSSKNHNFESKILIKIIIPKTSILVIILPSYCSGPCLLGMQLYYDDDGDYSFDDEGGDDRDNVDDNDDHKY